MPIPPRLRPWGVYAAQLLAVTAAYYAGARLGLLQALVNDQVTPLWPPTGLAVVTLLLGGQRLWPGIAIGAFVVNATLGEPGAAFLISAGNTLAPVVACLLLRHYDFRLALDRTRDAIVLIVLGAFAAMLVSASVGAGSLLLTHGIDRAQFWTTWSVWWTGDALGVLTVVPLVAAVRTARRRHLTTRGRIEVACLLLGTAAVTVMAIATPVRLLYLVFPFAVWAGLRFQHLGAAPCALISTAVTARGAATGTGPWEGYEVYQRMVSLQGFNATVVLTTLVLSAVIAERNAALAAIERTCSQLSDMVTQYQPIVLGDMLPPRRQNGQ
ncbi:MASE1 domain-containing protein [Saccharothrix violaceirubra]|uniref:Integral membrane sensor domain MASE1 n=1 Tax=Saccharothrix violaceirubra TaxID=413306 RepID=A0A7W7WUX0_9PSEU|nr:MASE1 domain-containing protein [Saccharothrix violaceirubra]MBB4964699.1 integral membrane sensor domain MASE1 [Saccharothrix violaceirubra]